MARFNEFVAALTTLEQKAAIPKSPPIQFRPLSRPSQVLMTLEANQRLNLTSITEPRDVALKHFLDSLAPHSLLDDGESVLDLGSGAGYPGIPLACALELKKMVLAESTLKKARFLREVAAELALPSIEVLDERGEEILRRVKVDTVLARACHWRGR